MAIVIKRQESVGPGPISAAPVTAPVGQGQIALGSALKGAGQDALDISRMQNQQNQQLRNAENGAIISQAGLTAQSELDGRIAERKKQGSANYAQDVTTITNDVINQTRQTVVEAYPDRPLLHAGMTAHLSQQFLGSVVQSGRDEFQMTHNETLNNIEGGRNTLLEQTQGLGDDPGAIVNRVANYNSLYLDPAQQNTVLSKDQAREKLAATANDVVQNLWNHDINVKKMDVGRADQRRKALLEHLSPVLGEYVLGKARGQGEEAAIRSLNRLIEFGDVKTVEDLYWAERKMGVALSAKDENQLVGQMYQRVTMQNSLIDRNKRVQDDAQKDKYRDEVNTLFFKSVTKEGVSFEEIMSHKDAMAHFPDDRSTLVKLSQGGGPGDTDAMNHLMNEVRENPDAYDVRTLSKDAMNRGLNSEQAGKVLETLKEWTPFSPATAKQDYKAAVKTLSGQYGHPLVSGFNPGQQSLALNQFYRDVRDFARQNPGKPIPYDDIILKIMTTPGFEPPPQIRPELHGKYRAMTAEESKKHGLHIAIGIVHEIREAEEAVDGLNEEIQLGLENGTDVDNKVAERDRLLETLQQRKAK